MRNQFPKQDISLLPGTFEMTGKMLDVANKLLLELEQVKDTPEEVNQLPISSFEQFIQLLPALTSHCVEWRLENLTAAQLKQIEEIEQRLEKIEECCLDSRSIMDYLLVAILSPKIPLKI